MLIEITMPKFGLSMEEGTIDEWKVELGQKVAKGDVLAEVSTDKITNSVLSPEDGYMRKHIAAEGDTILCGELIGLMTETAEEELQVKDASSSVVQTEEKSATVAATDVAAPQTATVGSENQISPRAKKIAEERGLSYAHIVGTGRLGMITVDDLKKHGKPLAEVATSAAPVQAFSVPAPAVTPIARPVTAPTLAPADTALVRKFSTIEKTTARAMHDSLLGSAQTTIATDGDMTNLVRLYRELKGKYAQAGVKLTYTALIVKAVAMALESHPKLRASLVDEDHVQISNRISIGVAVDLPDDNLVVPVIRDANLMDLRSIAIKLADLVERARNNALQYDELGDATLTISNMGTMGITYFTPVLNPPEGALLGIGALRDQIVVDQGSMRIAPVMYLSLTHDHRIINGGPAARFLKEVVESLQDFGWM